MTWIVVGLVAMALVAPQEPAGSSRPIKPSTSAPAPIAPGSVSPVRFDSETGWPLVADERAAAAAEPAPAPLAAPRGSAPDSAAVPGVAPTRRQPAEPRAAVPALASGVELGSPLLDVFQAVRAPGAFKALGGRVVWWRLTTYGPQGEQIGVRELTHTVDCNFAERDRIEHADGRLLGRVGALVFAERSGMPLPTQTEAAGHELALFGLQFRMPWAFADANAYAVISRDVLEQGGERTVRIGIERRPPSALAVLGPELDPKPRDRFELLFDPQQGGQPTEFVHRFASSRQTRRVLLEDWREIDGVSIPHRRVYVDDALRPTTVLEILRIEAQRVSERDFRLH